MNNHLSVILHYTSKSLTMRRRFTIWIEEFYGTFFDTILYLRARHHNTVFLRRNTLQSRTGRTADRRISITIDGGTMEEAENTTYLSRISMNREDLMWA